MFYAEKKFESIKKLVLLKFSDIKEHFKYFWQKISETKF